MKFLFLLAFLLISIGASSAVRGFRDKIFVPELPGRTNRLEPPRRQARASSFDPRDLKTPPRVINRRGKIVRRTSP
ncbi:hypothetical protein L5515_010770 [Caenorhabditis briggsae]|uniref:Uncharacterized protein n=1 Tax=Caenorhabditis briggsae TaxID=6238 RepID=A0AAE9ES93_CAEBR|nr:hypothetical protein L5515_010770 [Caenorhabditis briggsae]